MKTYKELLEARVKDTIVFYFGQCNPPTTSHVLVFNIVAASAKKIGADYNIIVSRIKDKTNPLSLEQKLQYLKIQCPKLDFTAATDGMKSSLDALKFFNKKYKNVIVVTSAEQTETIQKLADQYNGTEYKFDSIKVLSSGSVNPDKESTKMSSLAATGKFDQFKRCLMPYVRDIDGKRMMNDIRVGLGLTQIKESIKLSTSDIREKYRAGEIFAEGSFVQESDVVYKIINRNNNYLTLVNESGIISKKWLTDVQECTPTVAVINKFGEITEMKFSSSDKIKVAKIIGGMLGADIEKSSNPEQIVNAGLRIAKSKALNDESISILKKMLQTADDAGIAYDKTLIPSKVSAKTEAKEVARADFKVNATGRKSKRDITFDDKDKVKNASVDEVLSVADGADKWIKDFQDSDAPQFKGKSAEERRKMAIAAFMSKKNESIDEAKRLDPTEEHHANIKHRVEAAHVQGQRHIALYKADQVIADRHHASLNQMGGRQVQLPAGATMNAPVDTSIGRERVVKHMRGEAVEVDADDAFEFSDEDIESMVASIKDVPDVLDAYDDSELHLVDAQTGESHGSMDTFKDPTASVDEVPDSEKDPTKFVKDVKTEAVINEVLTREDRIKAAIRMRIHHAGMERKIHLALQRHSTSAVLTKRARKLAEKAMKIKIMHKPLTQFSVQDKERAEKIMQRRKDVLARVTLKLIPRVRAIEQSRMSHPAFTQGASK